jgi:L-asparaginase
MTIKLIITGGTIDKHYNELNGELSFTETHIQQMLIQTRCQLDLDIEVLMLKDSLEMTDEDRETILHACSNTKADKIVITHGTDTMTDTAKTLGKHIQDKSIALLGAMIPYELKNSDALFNLGCALTAVQCLESGIYITMNGKVFPWDQVEKNRQAGIFQ